MVFFFVIPPQKGFSCVVLQLCAFHSNTTNFSYTHLGPASSSLCNSNSLHQSFPCGKWRKYRILVDCGSLDPRQAVSYRSPSNIYSAWVMCLRLWLYDIILYRTIISLFWISIRVNSVFVVSHLSKLNLHKLSSVRQKQLLILRSISYAQPSGQVNWSPSRIPSSAGVIYACHHSFSSMLFLLGACLGS